MTATAAEAASVCLLLVYGGVITFFLLRWVRFRKPPSLGVAMLPTGWILVALWDLGILYPHPAGVFRWCGVVAGVWLLWSAFRAERVTERQPPR